MQGRKFAAFYGIVILLFGLFPLINGCQLSGEAPQAQIAGSSRYVRLEEAPYFVKMAMPADNPLTPSGIELGRRLFYDPLLSRDSTISCASCHRQELAFTDGRAVSRGVDGRAGDRSAMSLVNVGYYYRGLFWDGRTATLEEQANHPLTDPREMDNDWPTILERLRRKDAYFPYFSEAFGLDAPEAIREEHVRKALAQFQRTLVSHNAKWDRVERGEAVFTAAEKRGWAIFFDASEALPQAECSHCHSDPLFSNLKFFNNGIDSARNLEQGRAVVTGRPSDVGKFRTPTLRNIELTAPYMHDGRFSTLEEVIDHYASGGHPAPNVNPNVRRLNLTERDKADLIAFLKTLTDTTFIRNPDFANPFGAVKHKHLQ